MALDLTRQPWIFDAAAQSYARDAAATIGGPDSTGTRQKIYIIRFKLDTGNGGDFLINDANNGNRILKADNTPADDTLEWAIGAYWDGIYIQTLATNASLEVYHGKY